MNAFNTRIAALAFFAVATAAAHAGVVGSDPQLREGSTGVMTVASTPAARYVSDTQSQVQRLPHGETSTLVNGRPNAEPEAMAGWSATAPATRAMGAAMAPGDAHAARVMGGTPD